jgi:hypothetical protein
MEKKQPLKTQSVLLSRDKFTKKQAEAWIKKHDYKTTFYGIKNGDNRELLQV